MIRDRLKWIVPASTLAALLLALAFAGPLALDRGANADSGPTPIPVKDAASSATSTVTAAAQLCKQQVEQNRQSMSPEAQVTGDVDVVMAQAAAQTLGIAPQQLKEDLGAGQALSDLAASAHVTLQQVRNAMQTAGQQVLTTAVAQGTITQAQADSINRGEVSAMIDSMSRAKADTPQGQDAESDATDAMWQAAWTTLGLSPEQFKRGFASGTSIADLAAQAHVTVQQVEQAMIAAGQASLNAAVQQGTLTQAEATDLSQNWVSYQAGQMLASWSNAQPATPGTAACG